MSSAAVPGVSQDDFLVFTMAVNRFDLLDTAVASAEPYQITILDNSDGSLGGRYKENPRVSIFTPPVPLNFAQSSNVEYRMAQAFGKTYYAHFHSDAQFPSSKITDLLNQARKADAEGRKWLIIFSLYEILAVYNVEAMAALGGYDAHLFPFYFADNSLFRKAKLLGYELIEGGGDGVIHKGGGSVTINSDTRWSVCNSHTFPLQSQLYHQMWGGPPGHETFEFPFNRQDTFPDLKTPLP